MYTTCLHSTALPLSKAFNAPSALTKNVSIKVLHIIYSLVKGNKCGAQEVLLMSCSDVTVFTRICVLLDNLSHMT